MITWPEIRSAIQQYGARIANYCITSTATSKGLQDSVEGRAIEPGDPKYSLSVRRLWPFGLRSVPTAGSEGVILRVNAGRRSLVLIAAENLNHGRTDLKSGETQLYNKAAGCEVWLDENGQTNINAASSKKVIIQGGTDAQAAARKGDPVGWLVFAVSPSMAGPVVTTMGWSATDPMLPLPPVPTPVGSYAVPMHITSGSTKCNIGG